jgi:hypothetical protein
MNNHIFTILIIIICLIHDPINHNSKQCPELLKEFRKKMLQSDTRRETTRGERGLIRN